jgi:hypothetical protein
MKSVLKVLILTVLALISACTSFKEEDTPAGLILDRSEISLSSFGEDKFSVTVRSGDIWSVENKPSWIIVTSINRSNSSLFEWVVSMSASANSEYDREGIITFKSGSSSGIVSVIQSGKKGAFVAIESLTLDKTSLSMTVGETQALTATITPSGAADKSLNWSSSNESVAAVSSSGVVTAKAVGNTVVTVMTSVGNKTATCSVSVSPKKNVIQFADSNLKQYLLSYYDIDKDKEISYEEAAAVTSIVSLNSVKAITSFDEFQFFTGVQSVPDNWLKGCQSLKSVVFPTSIRTVGTSAFEDCKSLSSVNLNKDIHVEAGAFKGTSLSGAIHVEAFESDAFSGTTVSRIYEHSSRLLDFYEFDNCLLSIPTSCTICLKTNIYSALSSRIDELYSGISIYLADLSVFISEKLATLEKSVNDIEQAIQSMRDTFDYSKIDEVRQRLLEVQEYYMMIQQEMAVRFYEAGNKIDNCAYYFYAAINFRTDLAVLENSMEAKCSNLSDRISACNNALKDLENIANATAPHSAPVRTRASSGSSYSINEIVSLFNNHVTSFDE